MGHPSSSLSRREFLRLAGAGLFSISLPVTRLPGWGEPPDWPAVHLEELPGPVRRILSLAPGLACGLGGFLHVENAGRSPGPVPLARTKWNLERCSKRDRLQAGLPWGIVLHWYGDEGGEGKTVRNYQAGFDSLRKVNDEPLELDSSPFAVNWERIVEQWGLQEPGQTGGGGESEPGSGSSNSPLGFLESIYANQDPDDPQLYRTSAHFLVGREPALPQDRAREDAVGIVQTQIPDADGTPFIANHVGPLDYVGYGQRQHYFVRALDALGQDTLLTEMFTGRRMSPNARTIGIEITGSRFDQPDRFPPPQQIANVVALVWALMRRYSIPAANLLGHHELSLGKGDPGKKFMALIRCLIGVKALVEPDDRMRQLVFGRYLRQEPDPRRAIWQYFDLNWNYTALTSTQQLVYDWETVSKHWFLAGLVSGRPQVLHPVRSFYRPIAEPGWGAGRGFLEAGNHEGIDLSLGASPRLKTAAPADVSLMADGQCVFRGETRNCARGQTLMFRHLLANGAQVLSVYRHLDEAGNIEVGRPYRAGDRIGAIGSGRDHPASYVHFAVAYGATWNTDLSKKADPPLNAEQNWILRRYLSPVPYLQGEAERELKKHDLPGDKF